MTSKRRKMWGVLIMTGGLMLTSAAIGAQGDKAPAKKGHAIKNKSAKSHMDVDKTKATDMGKDAARAGNAGKAGDAKKSATARRDDNAGDKGGDGVRHGRSRAGGHDAEDGAAANRSVEDDGEHVRGEARAQLMKARRDARMKRVDERRAQLKQNKNHQKQIQRARRKQGVLVNEQRVHIRRMARLNRIVAIAVENENESLAEKANALIEKETRRHNKKMKQLAAVGGHQ